MVTVVTSESSVPGREASAVSLGIRVSLLVPSSSLLLCALSLIPERGCSREESCLCSCGVLSCLRVCIPFLSSSCYSSFAAACTVRLSMSSAVPCTCGLSCSFSDPVLRPPPLWCCWCRCAWVQSGRCCDLLGLCFCVLSPAACACLLVTCLVGVLVVGSGSVIALGLVFVLLCGYALSWRSSFFLVLFVCLCSGPFGFLGAQVFCCLTVLVLRDCMVLLLWFAYVSGVCSWSFFVCGRWIVGCLSGLCVALGLVVCLGMVCRTFCVFAGVLVGLVLAFGVLFLALRGVPPSPCGLQALLYLHAWSLLAWSFRKPSLSSISAILQGGPFFQFSVQTVLSSRLCFQPGKLSS